KLRREVIEMHRATAPLIDPLDRLSDGQFDLVADGMREYFRDVYDHIVRANEAVEGFRDNLTGVLNANLTQVSVRQNEDMRKIVAGEIPSERIDEDEHTVAFMDLNPWTRGHALVVPKRHCRDLLDIAGEDLDRTARAAKRLAQRMKDRLGCDGINLLNSCGEAA